MDLNAAAAAHEAHDRHSVVGRELQHGGQRVAVKLPGIVFAYALHRLVPRHPHGAQNAEELMHVGHPAPAVAQIVGRRHRALSLALAFHGAWEDRHGRFLVRRFEARHQFLVGVEVRRRPQMHLVHRLARRVE